MHYAQAAYNVVHLLIVIGGDINYGKTRFSKAAIIIKD